VFCRPCCTVAELCPRLGTKPQGRTAVLCWEKVEEAGGAERSGHAGSGAHSSACSTAHGRRGDHLPAAGRRVPDLGPGL
jgi:hypothetical protein